LRRSSEGRHGARVCDPCRGAAGIVAILSRSRGRLEQYVCLLVVISSLKRPISKTHFTAILNLTNKTLQKYLETLETLGLVTVDKSRGHGHTLFCLTPRGLRALDCMVLLDRELPFLGELIHTSPLGFLSAC